MGQKRFRNTFLDDTASLPTDPGLFSSQTQVSVLVRNVI